MKKIVVEYKQNSDYIYGSVLTVKKSTHPEYIKGTRFDYGFMQIVLKQGYVVTITPVVSKKK